MSTLFGALDDNLRHLEGLLNVRIRTQGHELFVEGEPSDTSKVARLVEQLGGLIGQGHALSERDVKDAAQLVNENPAVDLREHFLKGGQLRQAGKRRITAKSANQRRYLEAIEAYDIVFGVGPAGTGKTYLAMAQAVSFLVAKKVSRIILARPAVEAGEKLGFLPGDLQEKVNPYLRPLYDALYDMLDVDRVAAVRSAFPDIALSVDANAAYSIDDLEVFRALDDLDLMMIEQPLHHADLVRHAELQRAIRTPVCLDESIRSSADAAAAIELGSCRIVNIKQGRVGGIVEARRVHDVCRSAGVPVWCGGMLETGVGRAQNLALAAMPGFTLPGDTSASSRYFPDDLTEPFVMSSDGTMQVPTGPGIGVSPRPERLAETTLRTETLSSASA